jgi:hypothetical protein
LPLCWDLRDSERSGVERASRRDVLRGRWAARVMLRGGDRGFEPAQPLSQRANSGSEQRRGQTAATCGAPSNLKPAGPAPAVDDEHELSTGFLEVESLLLAGDIAAVPIVAHEIYASRSECCCSGGRMQQLA